MEWLLALVAGGGGIGAIRYVVVRRRTQHEAREELAVVRRLADEDVVVFGEQLQRLDEQVGGRELDTEARVVYQRALDAYESAQRAIAHLGRAEEISKVTDTLSTGRYALACVQARVSGRPLPELRTPCFFNPQHGPSVADVVWTTTRYGTRTIPACAQDAARVAVREQPDVRMAVIGPRRVPYWEAGDAFLPYSLGYFPAGTYAAIYAADLAAASEGWGSGHDVGPGDLSGGGDVGGDLGGDGSGF